MARERTYLQSKGPGTVKTTGFSPIPNDNLMFRDKYYVDVEQEAVITEYVYETVNTGGLRIWRGKVKVKLIKDTKGGEVNAIVPGVVTSGPKFVYAPPIGSQVLVYPYMSSRNNSIYIVRNYYPISFMGSKGSREANSSFVSNRMVNLRPGELYLSSGGETEKSSLKLGSKGNIEITNKEHKTSYSLGSYKLSGLPNNIRIQEIVESRYKRYIDSNGNKIEEGNNVRTKYRNQEVNVDTLLKIVSKTIKLFVENELKIKANKIGMSSENYIQIRARKLVQNIQEQYNTSSQSMDHKVVGDINVTPGGDVNINAGGNINLGEGGDKIIRLKDIQNLKFTCPFAGLLTMGSIMQGTIGSETCKAKD